MKNLFFKSLNYVMLSLLLPMMLLTNVTSCSKDEEVIEANNNNGNSNQQNQELVVTVDANGNISGGHRFSRIDETNFYIDDVKYTAKDGSLVVSGYDPVFFKGDAIIISKLIYNDQIFNVTGIADNAFKGCTIMTSVTIPSSITSIGNYAFDDCKNISTLNLDGTIALYYYFHLDKLQTLTLGKHVYKISFSYFKLGLTDVYCYAKEPPICWLEGYYNGHQVTTPENNIDWNTISFDYNILKSTILHVPANSVDTYKATKPWNEFKNITAIPNN